MANTLVVAGDIDDYGATQHDEDNLVVPFRTLSSWKTKKVMMFGIIMGVLLAVVVLVSVLPDAASAGLPAAARTGPDAMLLQLYPYDVRGLFRSD